MKGNIVIGYQGIGKTTLAKSNLAYIDLESSMLRVDGARADNWYKVYVNIALGLASNGYTVFTSSHKEVREYLKERLNSLRIHNGDTSINAYVCYPDLELKDAWIKRLTDRYDETQTNKDYRALANATAMYTENILDLMASGFDKIVITTIDYDLQTLLEFALESK